MESKSVWFACVLIAAGCAGEQLSVGEVRCTGEGVRCEPVDATSPDLTGWVTPDHRPPGQATVVWQRALPCPNGQCRGELSIERASTRVLQHADGSLTVAREINALGGLAGLDGSPQQGEESLLGVWLARFDSEGELLWENDSLVAADDGRSSRPKAALALDPEDGAVLAVQSAVSEPEANLSLYRIGEQGDLEHVFTQPFDGLLEDLAIAEGDVVIASYDDSEYFASPNPEVARYTDRGLLVWRQTALRLGDFAGPQDLGLAIAPALSLTTDPAGDLRVLVPERNGTGIVELQPDGNVGRYLYTGGLGYELMSRPAFAIDGRGRRLVGQNEPGIVGEESYAVARIEQNASVDSGFAVQTATRSREEFYAPLVLGLDHDAEDRVLVVTTAGTREAPRVQIDRISEDFTTRETFVVEGAQDLDPDDNSDALDGLFYTDGVRVGPDGDLYYWSGSEIGRIELP